jgi:hypothetical protein
MQPASSPDIAQTCCLALLEFLHYHPVSGPA